jgi:hypothetical protein
MYNEKELKNKSKKDLIDMLLKLDNNNDRISSFEEILSTVDEGTVLQLSEFSPGYSNSKGYRKINIIDQYVNYVFTNRENKIDLLFDIQNIKKYIKEVSEKINCLGSITNRQNDAFKQLEKNGYDCWIVIVDNTEGEREEDSVAQNNYVLLFENDEFSELVLFRTHYDSWSGENAFRFDNKKYYKIITESDFKVKLEFF